MLLSLHRSTHQFLLIDLFNPNLYPKRLAAPGTKLYVAKIKQVHKFVKPDFYSLRTGPSNGACEAAQSEGIDTI